MDFGLSETQRLFRDQVRDYVQENIVGENHDWDDGEHFPDGIVDDLAQMGTLGMTLPEEAGGDGLDPLTAGVVYEQLGRGDVAFTMWLMVQNIANHVLYEHGGERHRTIAKENAHGKTYLCWGLTEPEHGADARAIEASARKTESGWVVNGEKTAITGSTFGDYVILYARVESSDNIRPFLLPLDAPGVEVTKYNGLGADVSGWGQVFIDDAELEKDALIADDDGFKIAMQRFDPSRGWIPLYCLGAAQQSLEETVRYMQEREAFGKRVAEFQGPQFEIAEMRSQVESARLKAYEALWRATEGRDFTEDVSMAKLFGTELSAEVIHDCMVLHGHYGYSEDFNLEQRFRDVIGLEIGEGPHQIQKLIIARETFGREFLPY